MLRSLLLYTALLLGANAAMAGPVDWQAARDAGLRRLVPAEKPQPVPDVSFIDPEGGTHRLADYKGRVVLLNFWATWCAPCREEMPSLDRLEAEMGGEDFVVLPVATGRNPPEQIDRFFTETGLQNLPVLRDPRQDLARAMGVLGLPVTVLIDRNGNEVARLLGEADWASDPAQEMIRQLMAPDPND